MHRKIFYFLMILALSSSLLLAQKGKIKGKVTDLQTGDVLIGATVSIIGTPYGAQTGADGEYLIQNLDPGDYNVKVSYIGYKTMTWTKIRVNSDQTQYENFKLPSDDIQVNTVEVVAERKLIQKSEASSSTIKTADDIRSLPTRDINTVINLSAGVAPVSGIGTSIRGGRMGQTAYYLEGVQNTNPLTMDRSTSIAFDAVEEVSVQTGGMSAEYGNANSGVVRQSLKSGSSQFKASLEYMTDNVTFMSLSDIYANKKALGQYPRAYNETSLSLSGPLFSNDFRIFTNLDFWSQRQANDDNAQYPDEAYNFGRVANSTAGSDSIDLAWGAGQNRQKYMNQNLASTTTLNIDMGAFRVRLTGILGVNWSNTAASGMGNQYNSRGNNYYNWTQAYTARFTHILSNSMFYELNFAYNYGHDVQRDQYLGEQWDLYGDKAANVAAGADWSNLTAIDYSYGGAKHLTLWDVTFNGKDAITVAYSRTLNWGLSVSGSLNLNIGKEHSIKLGGEYRTYVRRYYCPASGYTNRGSRLYQLTWQRDLASLAAQPENAGLTTDQLKSKLQLQNYVGGYGYDADGNEANDDFNGPFNPTLAAAYLTDAIEFEDLIINVGLRYDYINSNTMQLVDPTNPQNGVVRHASGPMTINPDGWQKAPASSTVSPRINVVFPVSDKTKFRATYGNYVQMPRLDQMYYPYLNFINELGSGYFQSYNALNMRPTRTTSYEIGLEQEVTDFLAVQLTAYYRDIKNELTNKLQAVSKDCPWNPYITYENSDFATTKGIELNLNMRRYQRLLLNGSFSYSDARGTGSNPNSNFGVMGSPIDGNYYVPQYIAPLNYNVPVRGSINIDYRFGLDEGGPIFSGAGISLLMSYQNGHPYTRGEGSYASLGISSGGGDSRFRTAKEPLNSSYTPNVSTGDLRIDKQFRIWDKLLGTIYLRINNVFNIIPVYNVYLISGSPTDDGFLSDPSQVDTKRTTYGETWYAWNKFRLEHQTNAYSGQPMYGSPRTFILGFRLDY